MLKYVVRQYKHFEARTRCNTKPLDKDTEPRKQRQTTVFGDPSRTNSGRCDQEGSQGSEADWVHNDES
jgi:hypothetical protein